MPRGRPRQFDLKQALEAAMLVFWSEGYEGASCDRLLDAMDINSGSMYSAFGDKKALYSQALDHYAEAVLGGVEATVNAPGSPLAAIKKFLRNAENFAKQEDCKGCLITNTLIEFGGGEDDELAEKARAIMTHMIRVFEKRLKEAKSLGELDESADPKALASFLVSSVQGLSVLGRSGVDASVIRHTVRTIVAVLE
ncbi:HTH-type transcriptional repressor ComR [Planctomycetes bacterium MalM25]|nr:HTH-type transcriptional repressor ComR [Planctomycetes bacterium MalM25]